MLKFYQGLKNVGSFLKKALRPSKKKSQNLFSVLTFANSIFPYTMTSKVTIVWGKCGEPFSECTIIIGRKIMREYDYFNICNSRDSGFTILGLYPIA